MKGLQQKVENKFNGVEVQTEPLVAQEITDKFGKWMIVKKNPKKYGGKFNTNVNNGEKTYGNNNVGKPTVKKAKDEKLASRNGNDGVNEQRDRW